jgi:hypothetical protein
MEITSMMEVKTELPEGHRIFLQELCNSAAVASHARALSGTEYPFANGIMRAAAILLSLHHGVSVNEIEDDARLRATRIFSYGQDWRREIQLFQNHVNFNQD